MFNGLKSIYLDMTRHTSNAVVKDLSNACVFLSSFAFFSTTNDCWE